MPEHRFQTTYNRKSEDAKKQSRTLHPWKKSKNRLGRRNKKASGENFTNIPLCFAARLIAELQPYSSKAISSLTASHLTSSAETLKKEKIKPSQIVEYFHSKVKLVTLQGIRPLSLSTHRKRVIFKVLYRGRAKHGFLITLRSRALHHFPTCFLISPAKAVIFFKDQISRPTLTSLA